ncbi:MAG TPA: hypothetical protein VGN51_09205 [Acidimicrobiia bacterium]
MEIMSLGHAGLQLSDTGTIGLVDPWFDPAGAYLAAWFPLPDNHHVFTPARLAPDWVVLTGDGDDRCDPSTLARIRRGTPTFVPAGNRRLTARLRHTGLHVVEVPPSVTVKLDDDNRLAFLPTDDPAATARSVALVVDRVSLLACAPSPPNGAHVHDIRSTLPDAFDVVAVQVARPSRALVTNPSDPSSVRERAAYARAVAVDEACASVRAAAASTVIPYGGPPCFLDPELDHLNASIGSGMLPDLEQTADLLRARLPQRRVISLLPGDRCFPTEDLVVDDPRWRDFSFVRLRTHLRDYAHSRAVDLSRAHSAFPDPDASLGRGLAASLARLAPPRASLRDHVRFEVFGPGGGDWDVILDERGVMVDLSGRATAPAARVRIASRWVAALVDGRVGWTEVLRSYRYSLRHAGTRDHDPLLDFLEQSDRGIVDAGTRSSAATAR